MTLYINESLMGKKVFITLNLEEGYLQDHISCKISHAVDFNLLMHVQCWPKEMLQVLFYEAKVPNSDGYSTV